MQHATYCMHHARCLVAPPNNTQHATRSKQHECRNMRHSTPAMRPPVFTRATCNMRHPAYKMEHATKQRLYSRQTDSISTPADYCCEHPAVATVSSSQARRSRSCPRGTADGGLPSGHHWHRTARYSRYSRGARGGPSHRRLHVRRPSRPRAGWCAPTNADSGRSTSRLVVCLFVCLRLSCWSGREPAAQERGRRARCTLCAQVRVVR